MAEDGYPPIHSALERIGDRLDRIETKLDGHLERVSAAERDIHWLRGHVRVATAAFLAVVGFLLTALFTSIFPGSK